MSPCQENFKVVQYLFPRTKGNITCISSNFNYYFNTNLVVGPGALKNTCTCLSYCRDKDDEFSKAAKTEEAYADMGGEPIAAGTKKVNPLSLVVTKRSYILKQTCLGICDLFVTTRH